MISLSGITKQFGPRVLYANADMQIRPGDKIGLVGPNGAGKTTIFRLITGEERPGTGTVSKPDRTVIGYFSQDVGEMHGRSALEEVKAGAGKVSEIAAQMIHLQTIFATLHLQSPVQSTRTVTSTQSATPFALILTLETKFGRTLI